MIALTLMAWLKARRDGYGSPLARRMRAGMRVAGYCAVLGLGGAALSAKRAHAKVGEGAMQLGRELSTLGLTVHEHNRINLNGEVINIGTASSDEGVSAVLDHFEEYCRNGEGVFQDVYAKVGEKEASKLSIKPSGAIRMGDGGEGTVTCFERTSKSTKGFFEAATVFAQTQDLGALGRIRYAYVKRLPSGRSQVLTLWSEDSLRLDRIVPLDGQEGAGRDPVLAPRPPSSRRLITAHAEGTPYASYLFSSKLGPQDVLAYYQSEMGERGYESIHDPLNRAEAQHDGQQERMYEREGVFVTLVAVQAPEGSTVSLVEAGIGEASARAGRRVSQ